MWFDYNDSDIISSISSSLKSIGKDSLPRKQNPISADGSHQEFVLFYFVLTQNNEWAPSSYRWKDFAQKNAYGAKSPAKGLAWGWPCRWSYPRVRSGSENVQVGRFTLSSLKFLNHFTCSSALGFCICCFLPVALWSPPTAPSTHTLLSFSSY